MTATITRTFKPLVGIQTIEDLEGTILGSAARSKPFIYLQLPESGFYKDILGFKLHRDFLPIKLSADRVPIISGIHRAADLLVQRAMDYATSMSEDSRVRFREAVAGFEKWLLRTQIYKFRDLINTRDSHTTSSAYLVGVPYVPRDILLTGSTCSLSQFEVAVPLGVASKLGIWSGDIIQLCRFPETRTLAVKVRVVSGLSEFVLGLPMGDLAKLLGGDLDGDTYVLRTYASEECIQELIDLYDSQVLEFGDTYKSEYKLLGYWDEELVPLSEDEVADSKRKQKALVGPITTDGYAMFTVKLMAKDRLPVSCDHIRHNHLERPIEVAMDTKKALVHSDGTLHDPLLLRRVLNSEFDMEDERVVRILQTKLSEQGYDMDSLRQVLGFVETYGGNLRQLAYKNSAFKLVTRKTPDDVESFVRGLPSTENVGKQFVDCILGERLIKGENPFPRVSMTRSNKNFGFKGFSAQMAEGRMIFVCGLGAYAHPTALGGKAVSISEHSTEIAMFRRTVQVLLHPAGKHVCAFHKSWASLLNALATSNLFSYEVASIVREPDGRRANEMLQCLIQRMLRRMFKTYQVRNADVTHSWEAVAGAHKIVVVCFNEKDAPQGVSPAEVQMLVGELGGKFLLEHKDENGNAKPWINSLCDTIAGDPGSAYYLRVGEGINFITASDPLAHFISPKRYPVSAALSNAQEFSGAEPESFKTAADESRLAGKFAVAPPMREGWAVAVPFQFQDAFLVSRDFAKNLTVKLPKVASGCEFGSYDYFQATDGLKCQARVDLKGVAFKALMPLMEFADGTRVPVDIAFSMSSTSHEMLRHTHGTLALTAAAYRLKEETGGTMHVPKNVTMERIVNVAKRSGLYNDETLSVKLVNPETGEYVAYTDPSTGVSYDTFPGGRVALGVHRQVPEIVASTHGRGTDDSYFATSTKSGGVVSGLAGAYCMLAAGLKSCVSELHSSVNPVLGAELDALAGAIVRDYTTNLNSIPSNN